MASNPFFEFRVKYYDRPDLFVREVLGATPDEKQTEILLAVARGERRVAVRSGHGVGKTTTLAWLILWWIHTRFPQKTVCTAPTEHQLFDALAAETKMWFSKLPVAAQQCWEVQSEEIHFRPTPEDPRAASKSFVSFKTSRPDKPEAMAGVHSAHVLLVGDEASGIPEQVYEAAAGSMSGHSAVTVLAGNPVRGTGYFFECFHKNRGYWYRVHISCLNHPRVSPDFVAQIRNTYGERSNAFRVRVLGEFPLADDDTIIPADWADAAVHRVVTPARVREIWGVDPARFGGDATAWARRRGNVLARPTEVKFGYDTMQIVGWIKSEWDALKPADQPSEILVDVIGLGAGVVDRLSELGLPVRGINVSESPTIFNERYLNQRAELWFTGRAWLEPKDTSLGGDAELAYELKQPKYKFTSSGKIQVESKEDMKKRGIESPNRADAFLLTLAGEAVTAIAGTNKRTNWSKALSRRIKGIV